MDRIPVDPKTLSELIEADLRRAARLVIKVQDEIDPQFRIATPDGDYWLAVTLPPDVTARAAMFRRIATFMAWKQATAFTLVSPMLRWLCAHRNPIIKSEDARLTMPIIGIFQLQHMTRSGILTA